MASGSTCTGTHLALTSVSLFGGFVTATSLTAMNGRGTVSGLTIDGSPVSSSSGESALLGYWGQLTLAKTVGRLRAPLVVLLLKQALEPPGRHDDPCRLRRLCAARSHGDDPAFV